MEKFRPLGGLVLSKDPSATGGAEDPIHLTGGRNMLKHAIRGYRRRPGYGALNVQGGAAIGIGATDPVACWPMKVSGAADSLLGADDGTLLRFDGSDSFDQVSKSIGVESPTYGELGGYHLIAGGARALKYIPGGSPPSPLGSESIFEGEASEEWTDDGTIDTDNEYSGLGCLELSGTAAVKTASLVPTIKEVAHGTFGSNGTIVGLWGGDVSDVGQQYTVPIDMTIKKIKFGTLSASPTFTEDVIIGIQGDAGGNPDGTWLTSETVAAATINAAGAWGFVTVSFSSELAVTAGQIIHIVFVANVGELGYGTIRGSLEPSPHAKTRDKGGSWIGSGNTSALTFEYYLSSGAGADYYTNYTNASTINLRARVGADSTEIVEGTSTFIRFRTAIGDYFEYSLLQSDFAEGGYANIQLTRGSKTGATGADGVETGFKVVGSPEWTNIQSILISVQFDTSGETVHFDACHLLSQWAPPTTNKLFVVDGRVFVVDGREVYYSEKWNPNVFQVDSILTFPDTVVAVVEAGASVLFLLASAAWNGTPLSSFPDYKTEPLSVYGGIDRKAVAAITYKDKQGAAWVSPNRGVMFYNGIDSPSNISAAVQEIFTDGGSNNQNLDHSRAGEIMMFLHPRWDELWILYPTLLTGETNLKYGLIMNRKTGEFMPLFEWGGPANIEYASVYRDVSDNLYKMVLVDSSGDVWHEGFVGTASLSATTGKDGYVDGNTTGAMVKGYVELPFMGSFREDGTDRDQTFHDINVKYLPATTAEFSMDFDYKLAAKGEAVDEEAYPNEEEVVMSSTWKSVGSRETTPAAASDVVERNVKVGPDIKGHALAIRVGQVDTGGPVEWELYGAKVSGYPRYGKR